MVVPTPFLCLAALSAAEANSRPDDHDHNGDGVQDHRPEEHHKYYTKNIGTGFKCEVGGEVITSREDCQAYAKLEGLPCNSCVDEEATFFEYSPPGCHLKDDNTVRFNDVTLSVTAPSFSRLYRHLVCNNYSSTAIIPTTACTTAEAESKNCRSGERSDCEVVNGKIQCRACNSTNKAAFLDVDTRECRENYTRNTGTGDKCEDGLEITTESQCSVAAGVLTEWRNGTADQAQYHEYKLHENRNKLHVVVEDKMIYYPRGCFVEDKKIYWSSGERINGIFEPTETQPLPRYKLCKKSGETISFAR